MSNQQQSSKEENILGGVIVLAIVLYFVGATLVAVFNTVLTVAAFGAVGVGVYRLYLYDKRTGNLTAKAESILNLKPSGPQIDEADNFDFEDSLDLYDEIPEPVVTEPSVTKEDIADVVKQTIAKYGDTLARKEEDKLMNEIFGSSPNGRYDKSSEFELQQQEEQRREKEKALEARTFELSMSEQFFDFTEKIVERQRGTEERQKVLEGQVTALGQVVLEGFNSIAKEIMGINCDIRDLRGYVDQKVGYLENAFIKEIFSVKEMIGQVNNRLTTEVSNMNNKIGQVNNRLTTEVSNLNGKIGQVNSRLTSEISRVKLQFGKEVLRLDQYQMRLVSKMGEFSNKLQAYGNDLSQVRLEAEAQNMRGEHLINQANLVYQKHKNEIVLLSKDLSMGLQKMAAYDQSFAQKLGSAKIELEGRAKEMRLAIKEMGYERVGINAMRNNLTNQENLMKSRLDQRQQQITHLEQKINLEKARENDVSRLQHQLHMVQEQRQRELAKAEWMRRENSFIKKLA